MPIPTDLTRSAFPDARWNADDKPVLVLDGAVHRVAEIAAPLRGRCAYVVGVSNKHFPRLCERLEVELLQFYEMRVADLAPLERMTWLRGLALRWNTKVRDLSPLGALTGLRHLVLDDVPKAHDLGPLRSLRELECLEFYGGMWAPNTATTLAPLADLPRLEELTILNSKVKDGGLRPLAGCRSLRKLSLSNQFPTEDYAYLSVMLRETVCAELAPYCQMSQPIGGKDIMITGKGKPLLDSRTDGARIAKYEAEFRRLQEQWTGGGEPS